jgi:hypothetical protein
MIRDSEENGGQTVYRANPGVQFMRGWLIGGIVALTICAILVGRTAGERDWGRYLRLMREGVSAPGVVNRVETSPPCRAEYSFTAGGRPCRGSSTVCGVRVGQQVRVTYLAEDPSVSCIGNPGERLADEIIYAFFGGLFFPEIS